VNVDTVKNDSVSNPAVPTLSVEQLGVLLQDLHELLESHAPLWYTENMDTRLRDALGMLNLRRNYRR
jgi:hypothetical protein